MHRLRAYRRLPIALLGFVALAVADVKTVTKYLINGHESISTEYVQGGNRRWEENQGDNELRRERAEIWNVSKRHRFVLDFHAREYVESDGPDFLATLAMWIQRSPRIHDSSKMVNVYLETISRVRREVIELSEAPLDRALFEPPENFKRVDYLPGDRAIGWVEHLNIEWEQLEQAFESWFR